jgi:molybdopterin-guanine dinucleotide biosynthesis protein A
MGRDKAFLPLSGEPLGAHLGRIVESAAGSAVLVGDPRVHASLGYPVIPDMYPGQGPLGGILTALRHTAAEYNLIVACDMPGLTVEFLRELLDAAKNPAGILIPETADGHREPLCAIYGRNALAVLQRAFDGGIRKVTAAFEGLAVRRHPVAEVSCFQNLNTPEDWARYAAG